jgi:hypothetical protein
MIATRNNDLYDHTIMCTATVTLICPGSLKSKWNILLFQNCLSLTQPTSPLSGLQLGSPDQDIVNRHALQQAMRPLQQSTLRYFQQQQQQQQQSLQATLSSLLQYPLHPSSVSTLGLDKPWAFPTSPTTPDKPWLPLSPSAGLPSPIPNTNSLERAAQFHRNAACKYTVSRHNYSNDSIVSSVNLVVLYEIEVLVDFFFFVIPFYLQPVLLRSANCVNIYTMTCRRVLSSAPL